MSTEKQKAYGRKYYAEHTEGVKRERRTYYHANTAAALAYAARWRMEHPERVRTYRERRGSVTAPLIFQFLDNGGGCLDDFVAFLRGEGVPE